MALRQSEHEVRARAPNDCVVVCACEIADEDQTKKAFLNADIVFGNPPPAWLNDARRLKWLQLESVGFDSYLRYAREPWSRQITVTNLRGLFGPPVAETLLSGVLALYRRLPELIDFQKQSAWKHEVVRSNLRTVNGCHAIILGAGSIGRHLRQLLNGFGASTKLFARNAPQAELHTLRDLDTALPHADLIFGCLPDSSATRGLLNSQRFGLMKRGAILANGGRGSLVDENALIAALERGALAGAVLDVTAVEPLPPAHRLWHCPNVILTQHTGGGFMGESARKTDFFLSNLQRYRDGDPLLNVVDFISAK